ncbi:transporter substrate-binding domain-containing protein [Microbacterium sp. BWT-B31]|uniref:ABC transporter substrate-binding protein n=1 Tax=Microbacterium sp. BWT-B31 TaxID=3232072 RepID=UPI00352768EB
MSRRRPFLRTAVVGVALAALTLTGCASGADAGAPADEGYVTPGKLTIATGEPAYFPYVIDDDPTSGEGFESAVAYAVAEELGFAKDDVVWVRTTFDAAIAPGPKDFDVNIQQYSITPEREENVDFSSPYYEASQAVVAIEGSAAEGIDSIEGLQGIVLGAMVGSTSAQTIEEVVKPTTPAQLYNSNEDAKAALEAGQIDGLVLDLPTAYYATGVYIDNSFIVGELPSGGIPDQWGLLLANDSPLTARVTAAVDKIRDNGTLAEITDQWLGSGAGVTLLK